MKPCFMHFVVTSLSPGVVALLICYLAWEGWFIPMRVDVVKSYPGKSSTPKTTTLLLQGDNTYPPLNSTTNSGTHSQTIIISTGMLQSPVVMVSGKNSPRSQNQNTQGQSH